jgi:hypothetical protein
MRWRKLGAVFCPSGQADWMQSHAAVPIAERLDSSHYRIYFSTRDRENRSFTGFVVVDINNPQKILDVSLQPILSPGALGEFDDSGAMGSWIATFRGKRYFYYIGWNLGVTVPFRNSIGLAIDDSEGAFKRFASGPIVDRSMQEPHFCASCCVIPGEDVWRMWYLSCTGWTRAAGKALHNYHIKYAESSDGIHWRREGLISIDYADSAEYAISRPSVLADKDGWKMWYSHRGDSYRIGYAESEDGVAWRRRDAKVGIDVSQAGWDSEMIEYPFVFDHDGQRMMLYNGNGYGKTGFGLALLEGT